MDMKNVTANRKNGYYFGNPGYQGQGFVEMSSANTSLLRDTVWAPVDGTYIMSIRYKAPTQGVSYRYKVGSTASKTVSLPYTGKNDWTMSKELTINLKKGANDIRLQNITTSASILIDCIKVWMTDETKDAVGMSRTYKSEATHIRIEYYDMMGRKLNKPTNSGITIQRTYMSDGSVRIVKF